MKVCIVGAGALGCTIGGVLAEAGTDVCLINRNVAHVEAINRAGLILREAGKDRTVQVFAATDCSRLGLVDLVIVLVKSFHTRQAIEAAEAIIGEHTSVLSLQNGLGHEDILADVVGRQRVLAGKTYVGGVLLGPGHVIAGTAGKDTHIGELDGAVSARVKWISDVFNRAGLATTVSTNIVGTMWDKLLVNVATGALSGITRLPYGALYQVPEIEACALAAVAEAMAVAAARGVTLSARDPKEAWIKASEGLPPEFKASMLQSLEKGSVTEIDFINGAVVREGRICGVPTSVNEALVAGIKGIEHATMHFVPRVQTAADLTPSTPRASAHSAKNHDPATKSYVEHVAVRVKDIAWHIRFFREVLGMTIREVDGSVAAPHQIWTIGGIQLMSDPARAGPEGPLAHLGVMTENLEAALREAQVWGVTHLPQGRNWLALPDGLCVELLQASEGAVAQALAVDPRA